MISPSGRGLGKGQEGKRHLCRDKASVPGGRNFTKHLWRHIYTAMHCPLFKCITKNMDSKYKTRNLMWREKLWDQ